MKKRGTGSIYPRGGTSVWWCVYHLRGKRFRESTGETDEKLAQKYLDRRLMEVGADKIGARKFVTPAQEKLRVSDLLDALAADYQLRGKLSAPVRSHLKHLYDALGDLPASQLTAEVIDEYILARQNEDARPATINRATQLLRQSYTLAIQRRKLLNAPFIRHLSEKGNARKGFFEQEQFDAVYARLPQDLADFALYGYLTGWRADECGTLGWDDNEGDLIRLRSEHSKTGEARTCVLVGRLVELIERRRAARAITTSDGGVMLADLIFHCDGKPLGDLRKPWQLACCGAGVGKFVCRVCEQTLPIREGMSWDAARRCKTCGTDDAKYTGKVFHDFRRTAVRNLVRSGVPERVAMAMVGMRTRSIFDRYNITSEADLREAAQKVEKYLEQQKKKVTNIAVKKAAAK